MTFAGAGTPPVLVVPLDGHESSVRAVPTAGRMARRLGGSVKLSSVVADGSEAPDRTRWLANVASTHLAETDVDTSVQISPHTVDAIVAGAGEHGLLCMATAGSVRFHRGHFGSVAEGVARALDRPLIMAGPHVDPEPNEPTRRVVVPVDGSKLSEAAVAVGVELAETLAVPMWVLSVESPSTRTATAARLGTAERGGASGYVNGLAGRIGQRSSVEVRSDVVWSENADRAIVDFVGSDGTAVMSTHGRSGLGRFFSGSVTAGVVAWSQRPVVVLRPSRID